MTCFVGEPNLRLVRRLLGGAPVAVAVPRAHSDGTQLTRTYDNAPRRTGACSPTTDVILSPRARPLSETQDRGTPAHDATPRMCTTEHRSTRSCGPLVFSVVSPCVLMLCRPRTVDVAAQRTRDQGLHGRIEQMIALSPEDRATDLRAATGDVEAV